MKYNDKKDKNLIALASWVNKPVWFAKSTWEEFKRDPRNKRFFKYLRS